MPSTPLCARLAAAELPRSPKEDLPEGAPTIEAGQKALPAGHVWQHPSSPPCPPYVDLGLIGPLWTPWGHGMPAGGLGSPQSLFPLALWDQVALREPPS